VELLCAPDDVTPSQLLHQLIGHYIEAKTGKPRRPEQTSASATPVRFALCGVHATLRDIRQQGCCCSVGAHSVCNTREVAAALGTPLTANC